MTAKTMLLHGHTLATLGMFGVIWLVQLCHYPGFLIVGDSEVIFQNYHKAHVRQITYVVMPLMLLELGTAVLLTLSTTGMQRTIALVGLAVIGVLWASTMFVQVPMHNQLATKYDEALCRRLVNTNWIRTVGWTLRAGLALSLYNLTDMGRNLQVPGLTEF